MAGAGLTPVRFKRRPIVVGTRLRCRRHPERVLVVERIEVGAPTTVVCRGPDGERRFDLAALCGVGSAYVVVE